MSLWTYLVNGAKGSGSDLLFQFEFFEIDGPARRDVCARLGEFGMDLDIRVLVLIRALLLPLTTILIIGTGIALRERLLMVHIVLIVVPAGLIVLSVTIIGGFGVGQDVVGIIALGRSAFQSRLIDP